MKNNKKEHLAYFRQMLAKNGKGMSLISEGDVIMMVELDTTTNAYKFYVKGSDSKKKWENRLTDESVFCVNSISLAVQRRKGVKDNSAPITPKITYPDTSLFPATGEATALGALYDGLLNITVNRTNYVKNFSTRHLLSVPEAKVGGYNAFGNGTDGRGFYELTEPFIISGKETTEISLELDPTTIRTAINGDQAAGKSDEYNTAFLILHGFLAE